MRVLLLLLALLLGPAAALPGTATTALADDADAAWVPFELTAGNQIRFTATVNGAPLAAVLDTGVSASVLSRAVAMRAGLAVQPRGMASAIGGPVPLGWTATRRVAFGAFDRRGGGIAVAPLSAEATGDARGVDLLVGSDLIGGYAIDIDYGAQRFRLLPSGRMPFRGASAPLAISPESRVYITEMRLAGARLRPVVVDTGDGGAVTVAGEAWRAAAPAPVPTTSTIAYGIGGPEVSALMILPALAIGPIEARDVEVRVEANGGFSRTIGAAGRIGTAMLQRYRVLLDPGAGRMVLAPAADITAPPLRSTSGLLTRAEPGRLRVLHVMRGSPAEASGWRDGEAICSIDGASIAGDYAQSTLAGWSIGAPGRVVALGLCNGATRQLTLRHFY